MADPVRGIYYLRMKPKFDDNLYAKNEKDREAALKRGEDWPETEQLNVLVSNGLDDPKDQKEYGEAGQSDWMSSDYILKQFGGLIRFKSYNDNQADIYNNLSKYLLWGVKEGWLQLGVREGSATSGKERLLGSKEKLGKIKPITK